jgi:hypothetical protein
MAVPLNMFDEVLLDIELNRSELQELLCLAIRPWVRQTFLTASIKLDESTVNFNNKLTYSEILKSKKKNFEVDTSCTTLEKKPEVFQQIPSYIPFKNVRVKTVKFNYNSQMADKHTTRVKLNTRSNDIINKNKIKDQKEKRKILIIGDSHIKGFSSELNHKLGSMHKITGFVKTNASVKDLVDTNTDEVSKLTSRDILVFCGGSIDVSKNSSNRAFAQLINYLRINLHTNVVIILVPPRYDLDSKSCVNDVEVDKYNRKLIKVTKSLNRLTLINAIME